jgi:DnaK suppressor protein
MEFVGLFMSRLQIRPFGPGSSSSLAHSYGYEPANDLKPDLKPSNFRFGPHSPTKLLAQGSFVMSPSARRLLADQEYMNPDQLAYFRQRLLVWKDELGKTLAQRESQQIDTRVPDWLDSAALRTEQELGYVKRQRALRMLREIEAALQRTEAGDYGYCSLSGEEIGLERLEAMPIARFSVASQEELEQRSRIRR